MSSLLFAIDGVMLNIFEFPFLPANVKPNSITYSPGLSTPNGQDFARDKYGCINEFFESETFLKTENPRELGFSVPELPY